MKPIKAIIHKKCGRVYEGDLKANDLLGACICFRSWWKDTVGFKTKDRELYQWIK